MSINEIHFMREILVTDSHGKLIPTMETSCSNTACLHPIYKEVAFYDHAAVSKLYHELGGGRHEGALMGSTVILPHRSRWASLWRISPAEVLVLSSPPASQLYSGAKRSRNEKSRTRDRLMRD